jgi:hypothetical protein|tara:strand:+ start:225 stop:581 length:357 start_codon:yes stop_codon:yes gene_type:complete
MNNEITGIKISNDVNTSGTSFRGNVLTTYNDIVEVLGDPTQQNLDKVNVEWDIEFIVKNDDDTEREVIATIYDWKMPSVPYGLYVWHIGGNEPEAVDLVHQYLNSNNLDISFDCIKGV